MQRNREVTERGLLRGMAFGFAIMFALVLVIAAGWLAVTTWPHSR